jgi:hypothetical protein
MMNKAKVCLALVVFAGILAGCSSFSSTDTPCIKTSLVGSLATLPVAHFIKGDPRHIAISGFHTTKAPDSANEPVNEKDVAIDFVLAVPENDPSHSSPITRKARLPVFVALLDKQDNVLDRMDVKITINLGQQALDEPYHIVYHFPKGLDGSCDDYRLLMGFNEIKHTPRPRHHVQAKIVKAAPALTPAPAKKAALKKKIKKRKKKITRDEY